MYNNETSDPTGNASSTTIRELTQALETHVSALTEANRKLRAEQEALEANKRDLQRELVETIQSFVRAALPDLGGPDFDRLDTLAKNVPELTQQSIGYVRDTMTGKRDNALQELNDRSVETLDARTFQLALNKAQAEKQAAAEASQLANQKRGSATGALNAFTATDKGRLVLLAKHIQTNGGVPLTQDSRSYYEPQSLFQKLSRAVTRRGTAYNEVRAALKALGHGAPGVDVFADLPKWQKEMEGHQEALANAEAAFVEKEAALNQTRMKAAELTNYADSIQPDETILLKVQKQAHTFFQEPAFLSAAEQEYHEDLPRSIPLTAAKLRMLEQLNESLLAKRGSLNKELENAQTQYAKVSRLNRRQPSRSVPYDIEAIRAQNERRARYYGGFTTASSASRDRLIHYSPSPTYTQPTTVVVERPGMGFWDYMLFQQIFDRSHSHDGYREGFLDGERTHHHGHGINPDADDYYDGNAPRHDEASLVADPQDFMPEAERSIEGENAPFLAQLFGVDQNAASEMTSGISDDLFNFHNAGDALTGGESAWQTPSDPDPFSLDSLIDRLEEPTGTSASEHDGGGFPWNDDTSSDEPSRPDDTGGDDNGTDWGGSDTFDPS